MAQLSCCGVCIEVCGGAQRWKCKVGVFPCFRNYRPGHVEVQKQPLAVFCISFVGWRRQEVARISQIQRSQNAPGRVDASLDGAFIEMSCTSLAVYDTTKTAARVSSLLDSVAEEPHNDLQDLPFSRSRASGRDIERLCSQGHLNGALEVLSLMYQQGDTPSVSDYSCVLKACASRKALSQVKRIGAYLAKHRVLQSTRFLGENLVMALVKCGGLEDALQVFNSLPNKGVFSWTAMISGYSAAGQGRKALFLYNFMRQEGLRPDKYTFVSLLKACGSIADLEEGKRIHAEVLTHSVCSARPSRRSLSAVRANAR